MGEQPHPGRTRTGRGNPIDKPGTEHLPSTPTNAGSNPDMTRHAHLTPQQPMLRGEWCTRNSGNDSAEDNFKVQGRWRG